MLNQLKNLIDHLRRTVSPLPETDAKTPDCWRYDPLSHPELRNMSPDQLADLPLEPEPLQPVPCRSRAKRRALADTGSKNGLRGCTAV